MGSLNDDIKYACDDYYFDKFGCIFSRTNEELFDLFRVIDVEGQDVFTVLSSSDYLFSAIDSGASSVDTFDINPLTYRYYYLRKWLLQYGLIDAEGLSINDVLSIVNKCLSSTLPDEEDSLTFWKHYLSSLKNKKKLLYSNALFWKVKRPKVGYESHLESLSQNLSAREVKFQTADICAPIDIDRQYDTIFLSNILDHNRKDVGRLEIAADNLYRLLNDDGRVILSHFNYFPKLGIERAIFSNCFTYDEIYRKNLSYYQYRKK